MHAEDSEGRRVPSRRVVLAGAGSAALGMVAAVGACSTADTGGAPAEGASTPPSATGVGSAGTALGAATDVPVGGGKIFETLEVVVTQPAPNDFRGFSSTCTHTGCTVAEVVGGTINCPCHGSRFRLDGTVANGPAARPLSSRPVTVADGQVFLA